MKRCRSSFVLFLVFLSQSLSAGVTAKISGRISDKKTGGPLPGVNVVVAGTNLGAATDIQGEYFILQIPSGIYDVQIIMIGYKDVVVKDVKVMIDHTTLLNYELEEEAVQGETVVVVADRPVIQKDLTSSTQFMSVEEIEQLPIIDAREAIWLQTGVFFDPVPATGGLGGHYQGEQRYAVRGGSQDQVKWYYDGVRAATLIEAQADQAGSFTSININAIQEVQVVTGGFNAEYGEAQSGIVNVITKEGGDKFTGSVEYIYSPPGQRHFGNYLYDPNTQKEFVDNTLPDGTLDPAWWTPHRQSQIYDYREIPDHTLYLGLGGPLFKFGSTRTTFFVSSQLKSEAYTFPHPGDSRTRGNILANIGIQISPTIKLRFNGIYNNEGHSTLQRTGDFTNQAKYYRGWGSLLDQKNILLSAQWTHTISPNLFYDLKLSYYFWELKETPGEFTVLGESENPTLFGYQRYDGFENEPFDAYSFIYDQHKQAGDISLVGSLNWQIDQVNFVKTGFELRRNSYDEKFARQYPSFTTNPQYWVRRGIHETYHPLQFAGYLQSKMELQGMILNLGIRFDYLDPNYTWFSESHKIFNLSVNPEYDSALDTDGDQVDENGNVKYSFQNVLDKPRTRMPIHSYFSPRLGVSFPVTNSTLLHFNYGHFSQIPPVNRMHEFTYWRPVYITKGIMIEDEAAANEGREPGHIPSNTGDPERVIILSTAPLKPERTVMFEVGVKHNFTDRAFLGITAYYKDVSGQTSDRVHGFDRRVHAFDPFFGQTTPNVFFISNFPGDYGDSRGFEVNFRTLFSKTFTLDVSYSFSISTEGRATPARIDYDEEGNPTFTYDVDVNLRNATQQSFSRPHVLRTNLFLNYPEDLNIPVVTPILKNTNTSLLYQYISGQAFTFLSPDDPPDTYDNHRYPARQNVDLRVEKFFNIASFNKVSIYARITNLFNAKNLRSFGGDVPGDQTDPGAIKKFVETGEITTTDIDGYDISWLNYYEPRRFYLGLRYSFNQ
jgi:hypothetical protein